MKESGFYNEDPEFVIHSSDDSSEFSQDEEEKSTKSIKLPNIAVQKEFPKRKSSEDINMTPPVRSPAKRDHADL